MIFRFPKTLKVLKSFEYKKILRQGHFKAGLYSLVQFITTESSSPKLGITVTKKFGKANKRNRFKRVVREAFRLCQHKLPQNIEMNVRPGVKAALANPSLIEKELIDLTKNL